MLVMIALLFLSESRGAANADTLELYTRILSRSTKNYTSSKASMPPYSNNSFRAVALSPGCQYFGFSGVAIGVDRR